MTTIAMNKDMMAGDSQVTSGNRKSRTQKIHKVDGDIIGFCGGLEDGLLFVDWYKHKGDKPPIDEDFGALVLTKSGEMYEYGSKLVKAEIKEPFASIGSGSDIAIGAMEMGANPRDAVKIAAKWDAFTKCPVKTLRRD